MLRVWAVAANTIRQALRMKVAVVFIVLLLVLLPVMGLTAAGDGTVKGRLQTFLSYGLSLTSILLCLLTIIVSTHTITSDIEHRQIYTVATKPIRRYQFILGKLLGVIVLDVGLLALFAGIVYAVTVTLPGFLDVSPEERQQIDYEFYTARASLAPPQIDVGDEVKALYAEKENQLKMIYPSLSYEEIIKELTVRKRLEKRAVAVGQMMLWEFKNVKPQGADKNLFIRFKYDVSENPPDGQVYGRWQIGDLRPFRDGTEQKTPIWPEERKDPIRTFREIRVPADVIADDGYVAVAFLNPALNRTVVIFPIEDGLELLYKADTFTGNFIRAALLILCRLIFLAALGVLAASFLSFPVAILFCLVIFFTGTISGFILESFNELGQGLGLLYAYTIKALVQLLPRFDKYNPANFLVPARLMTWTFLARVVLSMVCIKASLLLLLGLVIFSFRELARIIV
jgi:hypothetical protein